MTPLQPPQHIGIVACSAEGAALCYRSICAQGSAFLGAHGHPEVSMHSWSLAEYVRCLDAGDLDGVGELMLASARKLARIGADILICPDNTIHQAYPYVAARCPLPWLHIVDVVADAALQQGYRRLGLLGTRWLVRSDLYPQRLTARGVQWVRPGDDDIEETSRIIMEELVVGVIRPESVVYFQNVITRLQAQGCDAVILGCTEIPLIISDNNACLPTLDSTRMLARAALLQAVGAAWVCSDGRPVPIATLGSTDGSATAPQPLADRFPDRPE